MTTSVVWFWRSLASLSSVLFVTPTFIVSFPHQKWGWIDGVDQNESINRRAILNVLITKQIKSLAQYPGICVWMNTTIPPSLHVRACWLLEARPRRATTHGILRSRWEPWGGAENSATSPSAALSLWRMIHAQACGNNAHNKAALHVTTSCGRFSRCEGAHEEISATFFLNEALK